MEVGEVGVGKADEAASKELAAEQAAAKNAAAAEPASMDVDEADPAPAPQEPPEQQLMQLMQDTQREQQKELKRLIWVYRWIVGLDPLSGRLIDSSKMDDLSDDEDVANSRDLPSNIRMLPIKRDAMRKLGILYSQNPKRKQSDIQEISKQLRTSENAVTSYFNYRSRNAQNQYSAAFPKKQPKLSKPNSGKHPLNPPNRPLVSKRPKQELPKLKKKEKSSMSELEISLQPCLNSDDGVKEDKALNFANAISGVVDGTDQPAVLNAIAETESVACLRKLVQYGILKVLNKWMTDAKAKNNSVIIRLALRVLHSVPMTLKNMSDSGIGRTVGKMRKEKDTKTADKSVIEKAKFLVEAWQKLVPDKDGSSKDGEVIPGGVPAAKRPRPAEEIKPKPKRQATEVEVAGDANMFESTPKVYAPARVLGPASDPVWGGNKKQPQKAQRQRSEVMSAADIRDQKRRQLITGEKPAFSPRAWRDPNAAAVWSGDFMDAAISPGGKVTSPGRAKKITWVEGGGGVGGVVKVFQSYKPFSEEWPTWGERGNTEELMKKERREEAKRSKQSAKQDSGRDAYDPGSPRDYNPEPKRDERHSQPDADAKSKRMEPQVSWSRPGDIEVPQDMERSTALESTELSAQQARQAATTEFDFKDFGASPQISEPTFDETVSMEKKVTEYPTTESKEPEEESIPSPGPLPFAPPGAPPGAIPPPPPSGDVPPPPPPPPQDGGGPPPPPPPPGGGEAPNPQNLLALLTQMSSGGGGNMDLQALLNNAKQMQNNGPIAAPGPPPQPPVAVLPPPPQPPTSAAGSGDATAEMLRKLLMSVGGPAAAPAPSPQGISSGGGNPFASVKAGGIAPVTMAVGGGAPNNENKPWNYKSKACCFFQKDGRCRNGANCSYYHDETERRYPQSRPGYEQNNSFG